MKLKWLISPGSMDWVSAVGCAVVLLWALLVHGHGQRQPPGPRALPIIGHFHLLTGKNKPIHQILSSLSALYRPIMLLRFGARPVLVINSSELANQCYSVNDLAFASRPQLAQAKYLGYNFYMLGWAPYGAYWRNVRKICVVELLSSKRIQSFQPKRTHQISKAINSLFQLGQLHHKIIKMKEFFFHLSFDILMGMIIGDQYFRENSVVSYDEVKHAMEESLVLHGAISIGDYIPWLKPFDLQGYEKAMKNVQRKLDFYLQKIVEKHRQNESDKEEVEMDFIDVLIAQEKNEPVSDKDAFVKATVMQMIIGGTETSSVALEWELSLLLFYPHTLKKAHEELDSKIGRSRVVEESDIGQLKYLQAIVKETIRLYPPIPLLVPHKSIEACTVGGFHIPAGTTLMINAWAIQRDEKVWNNPLEFIPERFMDGGEREIDSTNSRENDFGMVPFGAGRRGCPGSSLAMCTMNITLARLLQAFHCFVPKGQVIDMNEGVGITMPRAKPLEVVVQPRLPKSLY